MFSDFDRLQMQRALVLAERGLYTTSPNPRVGCVLVKDGEVIGEGFTQPAGQDHAEIRALKDARSRGYTPAGATAYVTLEPCSHFGRTPPCANTLVEAGMARIIVAMEDPNPQVSGRGLAILRDAGIDVRCGLLAHEAQELNIGFVSRMTRGVPWVRLKLAATLDGRTALPNGQSQWITSNAARTDGHTWRARACATLTGIGTVREDDPQMTVRAVPTPRQPLRVLVDSRLDVPLNARILAGAPPLVICARDDGEFAPRAHALRAAGAEVIALPNRSGKVDLPAALRLLAARGVNELHVEAGYKLNGSLLREGCVDELLLYIAPALLGNATGMFNLEPPPALDRRVRLRYHSIERIGDDLRVLARLVSAESDNAPQTGDPRSQ
ncbi:MULTISPECIES: bifunctional diaminohydroxyphosphoribosylaminopyrimidine deaminase/5-amino-6-(5-phosphoribosylamino)uracil reductase RibD [Burkholderiaceae]|uniref:bifunctional diaminohydroxyphosphoribosylaminopyrimidine deaminase/5-amino-6-(5-phosphoribosylamino)uracil reductase RibD n=1 Tax=Burkholderiaceae TaxID=119060 RepID=UPI000969E7EB|nr:MULTISPECIES: bifunctional diaminohydroxyphosphoribosylaminopyrimidine deaminase/5-amino-6-(5-phosphoribosylamino)uracil reductase RibD [Burkholderiaceae]MCG1019191.1 bifunctional diaminohydroxyphosphoribosylaminopyrimidine deaminase/5-amino-6-(5-phosphoribosylamino)uracil reductase RibD [Mycetohabitans sp. B4]MCG1039987.1 bifunctional diaminohydroxyphosphoribosylaminopyrimidine deaminase/5-amino-6-(5-phosphoribosylamino)uracil reductase RibD [Mycetohabitans sp. B7]SIT72077.1 diaminohydroxyph